MNWAGPNCSGLGRIRGRLPDDASNPTHVSPSKIQAGRRHDFRVRVACAGDQAEIVIELDGMPYFRWKGPESELSFDFPGWDMPHQRTIGIGANGQVTYHELTLKMLDGEAWLLRPPPQ
jgi:hypothetical protein